MLTYKSPLRDFQFVLEELLEVPAMLQTCGQSEFDRATIRQVLEAAGEFATEVIAPLNGIGDQVGCKLDAASMVCTPPGFQEAYRQYTQNGWTALNCSPKFGGQGCPEVVGSVVTEIVSGANMAWSAYPGMSHATYVNVEANASDELKARFLPKLASGEWAGTMCLTEPHAGTDLGLLRARAVPSVDDTYRITGTKIFISGGDQDLTDNILHLVLARLPDAPPGVKGISLFLVPKFLPDANGSSTLVNGVSCGNVEEKMGIHGNSTCTMNFEDSTGWLVGEPDKGLAAMFVQMNHARIMVGITAIGVMEAAFQKSLAYAKDRAQGRAPGARSDSSADLIVAHADVRRMLLAQKANVEGMRAVALWAAQLSDVQHLHPDPESRKQAADLLGLMTPIVKAMASDLGVESTVLAMQVFGGHGFIRENGVEQHLRDVRIIGLYEGTNGVQAMESLGRKVLADQGQRLASFLRLVSAHVGAGKANPLLREFTDPLSEMVSRVDQVTKDVATSAAKDPHAAGAAAVPYLRLVGHLVLAWMWARTAEIALRNESSDDPVYATKLATARFYFQRQLPQALALAAEISAGSSTVMGPAVELL